MNKKFNIKLTALLLSFIFIFSACTSAPAVVTSRPDGETAAPATAPPEPGRTTPPPEVPAEWITYVDGRPELLTFNMSIYHPIIVHKLIDGKAVEVFRIPTPA